MITINNLSKNYASNMVYRSVNLELPSNRAAYLMGKNGAGKTTLLKCLLELEPYQGEIRFDGKKFREIQQEIFAVYDDCPFYDNLSGYKNINLFTSQKCKEQDDICNKYLSGDVLRKSVKSYSYGQRKKLALIITELLNPKYLFLDEISNGLDYEATISLQKHIISIKSKCSVVLIGHQFDFYESIVDDVYIINNGTISSKIDYTRGGKA